MVLREVGRSLPHRETPEMNAAAVFDQTRQLAVSLEHRERVRGSSVDQARQTLARRIGVGAGTFENLVRGRVKRVDAWIRDRLQALLVRELEAEIARLTHELQMVRQCGDHLGSQHVVEIETHLAKARALLEGRAPS